MRTIRSSVIPACRRHTASPCRTGTELAAPEGLLVWGRMYHALLWEGTHGRLLAVQCVLIALQALKKYVRQVRGHLDQPRPSLAINFLTSATESGLHVRILGPLPAISQLRQRQPCGRGWPRTNQRTTQLEFVRLQPAQRDDRRREFPFGFRTAGFAAGESKRKMA